MQKHNLLALCLLALLTAGATFLLMNGSPTGSNVQSGAVVSRQAPNFTYTSLSGENGQLYDFKGKIVLINFWATWCAPCVKEYPDLLELAHNMDEKLVLLALSNDQTPEKIEEFIAEHTPEKFKKLGNVHIIWDQNQKVTQNLFQTFKLPETVIIAPDMSIHDKIIGVIDWTDPEIEKKLEKLYLND